MGQPIFPDFPNNFNQNCNQQRYVKTSTDFEFNNKPASPQIKNEYIKIINSKNSPDNINIKNSSYITSSNFNQKQKKGHNLKMRLNSSFCFQNYPCETNRDNRINSAFKSKKCTNPNRYFGNNIFNKKTNKIQLLFIGGTKFEPFSIEDHRLELSANINNLNNELHDLSKYFKLNLHKDDHILNNVDIVNYFQRNLNASKHNKQRNNIQNFRRTQIINSKISFSNSPDTNKNFGSTLHNLKYQDNRKRNYLNFEENTNEKDKDKAHQLSNQFEVKSPKKNDNYQNNSYKIKSSEQNCSFIMKSDKDKNNLIKAKKIIIEMMDSARNKSEYSIKKEQNQI